MKETPKLRGYRLLFLTFITGGVYRKRKIYGGCVGVLRIVCPQFCHKDWINHTHGGVSQTFEMQEDMGEWFLRSLEESFVTEFLEFASKYMFSQHPLVQKGGLSDGQLGQIFDVIGSRTYDE